MNHRRPSSPHHSPLEYSSYHSNARTKCDLSGRNSQINLATFMNGEWKEFALNILEHTGEMMASLCSSFRILCSHSICTGSICVRSCGDIVGSEFTYSDGQDAAAAAVVHCYVPNWKILQVWFSGLSQRLFEHVLLTHTTHIWKCGRSELNAIFHG